MSKDLFRKKALDKLVSPEQLDKTITIISPTGWVALLALGAIVLVAFFWGIYGTIYYRTVGWGIMVTKSGIHAVQAPSAGRVRSLDVEVGDFVSRGQVIGRIAQPETLHEIERTLERIKVLKSDFEKIKELDRIDLDSKTEYLNARRENIKKEIAELEEHHRWLDGMMKAYEGLRAEGAMSEVEYHKNRRELIQTAINIQEAKNNLNDVEFELKNIVSTMEKNHLQKQIEINDEEQKYNMLWFNYEEFANIVSKNSGTVLELLVNQGEIVNKSDDIVTLVDEEHKIMEAIVYFDAMNGKKIRPGMRANVTPSVIQSEKFGSIVGVVTEIGRQPSTRKAIEAQLQNVLLAEMVTRMGPPFVAKIKLFLDPNTVSGYKWTSSNGPPIRIMSGTVCTTSVVTRTEAPLNLLFQSCKKYLLGIGDEDERMKESVQS
jgi:HlyD family secretion protein